MMKNKGLIASVVVIIAIVIGFFIYQTMNTPAKTSKKSEDKVQTVGILQFVVIKLHQHFADITFYLNGIFPARAMSRWRFAIF